jgi:hypothetical protein
MPSPSSRSAVPAWIDRPMRWAQLALAERDPADYDLRRWLEYFETAEVDGACLSAGGYVAYYPTELELHHRSAWMGDGDPFGDLVTGCRALGMTVLARSDPHAVHQDVFDAHPDWIAVDADGTKRKHWAMPNTWLTCTMGPYGRDFMNEVHKEIVSNYDVDGIFCNRWSGTGMCFCEHCKESFFETSGFDLPLAVDPADPAYRAYLAWREHRLLSLVEHWDDEIRAIKPEARFIPNGGGGSLSELDTTQLALRTATLFADRQARHGVMLPWASGKSAKEYRTVMGEKPIGGIFGIGLEEEHRWKDSVQNAPEFRVWVSDLIANGSRPWFAKFGGHIHDSRWLEVVADLYQRAARDEKYLRNTGSLAEVGLVFSQQNARFYGGADAQAKVEDHIQGMYQALIEARIPFEMIHDRMLDETNLASISTLILANTAALSDAQCDQLRAFVARGGNLVATYETSLYDEWGVRRADFGLGDLFGVAVDGEAEGPVRNSYLEIERGGPLSRGFEGADWIINGTHRVPVVELDVAGRRPSGVGLIPSYPDLPMEEVYPRVEHATTNQVLLRQTNGGRVAYLPWDADRTFWEILNPDHALLLRNVVDWAIGGARQITIEGPGVFDVTVWRQADSLALHLVNLTNPMMLKGPFRELYPVGPERVSLRLPADVRVESVRLLHADTVPEYEVVDGRLEFSIGEVVDHEIVAIDLG